MNAAPDLSSSEQEPASRRLSVLYVGLKYDYGEPARGPSFEQTNFWHTLSCMKEIRLSSFFFDEVMREDGREEMNRRLSIAVDTVRPDVCFVALFTDEIMPETIQAIGSRGIATVNWFSDDHWRFDSFSRYWGPLFSWVVTTDGRAVEKYREIGCERVILSQWACNHFLYKPSNVLQDYEVTFVGQVHSSRKEYIRSLRDAGIDVRCWGRGWEQGRMSQEEMIKLYSRSKINLNFTESSAQWKWKPLAKIFLKRRADGSIQLNSRREMLGSFRVLFQESRSQIKGRNFEIPGSGGFLLTSYAERLEDYYSLDKEVAVFNSKDELQEKIRYYLKNGEQRETIRRAGYERTMSDHTFEKRFRDIFRTMGFEV
jgi:spore maturation protein CgeB